VIPPALLPGARITDEQVAHGGEAWKSPRDLSAKVWLAWRGEYLYLAADVTDDHHVQRECGRGS
jgi:hypothetical protein